MHVIKFGGTSIGTKESILEVISIIKSPEYAGKTTVMVVSALSGITDGLINAAREAAKGNSSLQNVTHSIAGMKKRHVDISAAFLKGEEKKDAALEIEQSFRDLSRMLDGISILREISPRVMDSIMSYGEMLSAPLIARILRASGIPSQYLDSRELIITDKNFGAARIIRDETYMRIKEKTGALEKNKKGVLFVVPGFIASSEDGSTTTLGRGGSDLSAAIFGAALRTEQVDIWTDVDGILTADPHMVKNAFRIDSLSYEEALELSHFGAKVLYPPSIKPALDKNISIIIRNTFNPSNPGTKITSRAQSGEYPIRGISSLPKITLIRLQGPGMMGVAGFSSRFFSALARRKISVILISQAASEYSICAAVDSASGDEAVFALREEFGQEILGGIVEEPVAEENLAIIAVVGGRMKQVSGISGKVFHSLGRNGINVVAIAQGSSELNISLVIARSDEAKALNAIHEAFFLAGIRSVNLFLLGTGLIGGTLLDQLADQQEILAESYQIRIKLVGAGNYWGMIFNENGLKAEEVRGLLKNEPPKDMVFPVKKKGNTLEAFDLKKFIETMKNFNLPNSAFCDCTANDEIAAAYGDILTHAIPIVTPNKRANSGKYSYYKMLTSYSRERGIPYLYETTVCAGLPVISTLRDLFLSGDHIIRIEAVVSGTLSYIFNNFDGKKPFSALVREAKAAGYTEPDPRDDLNAMDAARKALILARECGMPLEFSAVKIEPLLPAACFAAPDVESFFTELEKCDADFESRRSRAEKDGKALRYVVVIEAGKAKLLLRNEERGSPFLTLNDSDNMVVIRSARYSKLPMVIKGPGAGAQVTAGGVFADIVRIARTLV